MKRSALIPLAAALAAAVLYLTYHAMQPAGPDHRAAQAAMRSLVPVLPADLPPLVRTGRPAMLVVYASWCPLCRATLQDLHAARAEKRMEGVDLVMLSLDTDFHKLGQYLVESGQEGTFTPYVLRRTGLRSAADIMRPLGGHFDGAIPYTAYFTRDGKMVAEHVGKLDKGQLLILADKLRK